MLTEGHSCLLHLWLLPGSSSGSLSFLQTGLRIWGLLSPRGFTNTCCVFNIGIPPEPRYRPKACSSRGFNLFTFQPLHRNPPAFLSSFPGSSLYKSKAPNLPPGQFLWCSSTSFQSICMKVTHPKAMFLDLNQKNKKPKTKKSSLADKIIRPLH